MNPLAALARERSIVVCCGSGGVGKTTTSAALAIEAAAAGRRACVVTIDPAKRLADALGLAGGLTGEPRRVDGPWPGELHALMLDVKSTFDELVIANAPSRAQAERILANRIYRNVSGTLGGTQEYMAMEKLHELHGSGRFDVVVVDTPPTRNALDFLDAPRRLTRLLENRAFRVLVAPGRAYLRAVGVATQALLRGVSKVVGGEVVSDAVAFFQAFEGMEEGFRRRADEVLALLASDATAFVLVTSPRADAVAEAGFFAEKLDEAQLRVAALVVNRVHPTFPEAGAGADPVATPAELEALAARPEVAPTPLAALARNLAELRAVAALEREAVAGVAAHVGGAPVLAVPFLTEDVHDIGGLEQVRAALVAG